MKHLTLFLLLAGLLLAGCTGGDEPAPHDHAPASTESAAPEQGLAAYDDNGDGIVYQDGMHPQIVRDEPGKCPICGMKLTPVHVDGSAEAGTVKIDPVTLQNMGVTTTTVEVEPLRRTVRATGHFEINETAQEIVAPKISGWVEMLYVDYEGAVVQKGQPLLEIYSPELVSTQEEYLLALRHAERVGHTEDARRLVEAARRRLAYWDISEAQIERLKETGEPQKTLTLYAPASGVVTRKSVVQGQKIGAGQPLLRIADLNPLWLVVELHEQALPWVKVGSRVRIELPYGPGRTITGRVDFIYDMLDPQTRTVRARIVVPNPGSRLKPGMYATAFIQGGMAEPAPVVPSEAVLWTGEREMVLLALGDGRFRPAEVETGLRANGKVQILDGLDGGERIVTSAQFLIGSEAQLQNALAAMTTGAGGEDTSGMGDMGRMEHSRDASAMAPADMRAADRDGDGFVYQGPMHPSQVQDMPGTCTVCGMKLKRVPVEEAIENLNGNSTR